MQHLENITSVTDPGRVDESFEVSIKRYAGILSDYNLKVNLVSRNITSEGLEQLLKETVFLNNYISFDTVVDAGSGNGILGVPIAVINKNKKIVLVEPQNKKIVFLRHVKDQMNLGNVEIFGASVEEYIKGPHRRKESGVTFIARGFPDFNVFTRYLDRGLIREAVLITSENKIKKNEKHLESVKKKIYNVPLRTHLKILKIF